MKIRIRGNSLRLRLTQSEVKQLRDEGVVREVIMFGTTADKHLSYTLQKCKDIVTNVDYTPGSIRVELPERVVHQWADSDEISLYWKIPLDDNTQLDLLVEKDFNCLKPRANEDESDMFPHPGAGKIKC